MKLSRAAIALYVGLVFTSGGVLGWFGQRLYHESAVAPKQVQNNPKEFVRRLTDEYTRRLTLSPEQVTKMGVILDDTLAQFNEVNLREKQEVRERDAVEFRRIRQGQIDKIRHILSAEQKAEYEKMLQEREHEREQKREQQKQNGGIKGGRGPGLAP